MKAYTDLEQSKKLATILPIESADMFFIYDYFIGDFGGVDFIRSSVLETDDVPCWSLASLLNILSNMAYAIDEDASVSLSSYKDVKWDLGIVNSDLGLFEEDNPIDACVEMIYKLKERNLL